MKLSLFGFALVGFLAACSSASSESATDSDPNASHDVGSSSTKTLQTAQLPDGSTKEVHEDGSVTITSPSGEKTELPAGTEQPEPKGGAADGAAGVPSSTPAPLSKQRALAAKLGTDDRFLFGLGNDPNGNGSTHRSGYELGTKIDIHYMYLSGMSWPTWNSPSGAYVGLEAAAAKAHGAIPMFTLYQAAEHGDGNLAPFATDEFMTQYWANVRVMFTQLDTFGDSAIVHVEPDFWGYAQKQNGDAKNTRVKVNNLVPECKDLPNDVSGFGKCMIRLARKMAPNVAIGLHASPFGSTQNGVSQPDKIAAWLKSVGADQADLLILETLDRDAGCFEAGTDPNCKRTGSFYWSEKDYATHLAWAKALNAGLGLPLLWWQMPLGVPNGSAGTASHYRDNRVQYTFAHPEQFVAAGGIGAVFGTGAKNQTTVETDGGQFKKALAGYAAKPVALP